MFVAFYPPETHSMSAVEYTTFFRTARNVFLNHAPMTAFVWISPGYTATPLNPFYPGHNAVDWVALPLMACWSAENSFTDILGRLETFYDSFHRHKPIMVLPLGVSHFTRGDYRYRLNQAGEEITRIYRALQNFPRVGLIVYSDAFTISRAYTDDFSVLIEPQLITAYRKAVENEFFLSSLQREATSQAALRWVRLPNHGYYHDGRIYIPQATENETVELTEAQNLPEKIITACVLRQVIFVENKP
jgi:hypothetical protein